MPYDWDITVLYDEEINFDLARQCLKAAGANGVGAAGAVYNDLCVFSSPRASRLVSALVARLYGHYPHGALSSRFLSVQVCADADGDDHGIALLLLLPTACVSRRRQYTTGGASLRSVLRPACVCLPPRH